MIQEANPTLPQPGRPARYRIIVSGALAAGWVERLGEMRIIPETDENAGSLTTLVGEVKDQAELIGILNSLHGICLPVVRVEVIDNE